MAAVIDMGLGCALVVVLTSLITKLEIDIVTVFRGEIQLLHRLQLRGAFYELNRTFNVSLYSNC